MDWFMNVYQTLLDYVIGEELWKWVIKTVLRIILIIVLAYIAKAVGDRLINSIFKDRYKLSLRKKASNRREETLKNLMKNVLAYLIVFIVIMMILDTFNVPIKTMLAGAGVVGLAIGFGAQTLVRDIIAGFFIIFEDQFAVGDYIETGEIEGDVVTIGMRTTKLRSFFGQTYVIPNGAIDIVNNYSMTNGFAMVEVNIAYESDHAQIEKIIQGILDKLPEKYDMFIGQPEINGVQDLELSNYILRIRAETEPVQQWAGARAIRKEIKENLFEQGINIPSPRMVVYTKDNQKEREVI